MRGLREAERRRFEPPARARWTGSSCRRSSRSASSSTRDAELPNEACALLGGAGGVVTSLHPARNAAASPYRFELDPADLVRVVHAIEAAGEELVAIFHSHPASGPEPSPTDLREARYDVVQLIAGTGVLRGLALRGRWRDRGRARGQSARLRKAAICSRLTEWVGQ